MESNRWMGANSLRYCLDDVEGLLVTISGGCQCRQ